MGVLALVSCRVELATIDMSQYSAAVEVNAEGAELDTTNFASGGWEALIMGLKKFTLKVKFNDDYAASTVDDRVWGWFNTGTNVAFKIRPTSAAISATNPSIEGLFVPSAYTFVGGSVGDLATKDLTWPGSGSLARAVA